MFIYTNVTKQIPVPAERFIFYFIKGCPCIFQSHVLGISHHETLIAVFTPYKDFYSYTMYYYEPSFSGKSFPWEIKCNLY